MMFLSSGKNTSGYPPHCKPRTFLCWLDVMFLNNTYTKQITNTKYPRGAFVALSSSAMPAALSDGVTRSCACPFDGIWAEVGAVAPVGCRTGRTIGHPNN